MKDRLDNSKKTRTGKPKDKISFEDYLTGKGIDIKKYKNYLESYVGKDAETLTVLAFAFDLQNERPRTKLYKAINYTFRTTHTRAGIEYHFKLYDGIVSPDRTSKITAVKREIKKLS